MTLDSDPTHRIAILDDDIQFIRLVERILQDEQVAVEPVTTLDVEEAARVITARGCDLAMVDVFMYGAAAGFDLVELLRNDPRNRRLPILVTSGARREIGRKLPFLQERRCAVLLKPFEPDALVQRMQEARSLVAVAPVDEQPVSGAPAALPRTMTA